MDLPVPTVYPGQANTAVSVLVSTISPSSMGSTPKD